MTNVPTLPRHRMRLTVLRLRLDCQSATEALNDAWRAYFEAEDGLPKVKAERALCIAETVLREARHALAQAQQAEAGR